MAKAKAIVKRRKAVTNIKKITRTMQLIATAKFQKTLQRATATKPYTAKLTELVGQLSAQASELQHPLLTENAAAGKTAILVITSSRGLCGGYNARVITTALTHIRQWEEADTEVALDVSGKKGVSYFRFIRRPVRKTYLRFDDRVRFEEAAVLADEFIELYSAGQLAAVHVAYMKFMSVARQTPEIIQLLPIQRAAVDADSDGATAAQYEFLPPDPAELLADLLPATVRTRLFQCFTDAAVSEQIARMVAMKAATDAAGDMIKILTRTYNRARQSQITMELLDIMGGAEALA